MAFGVKYIVMIRRKDGKPYDESVLEKYDAFEIDDEFCLSEAPAGFFDFKPNRTMVCLDIFWAMRVAGFKPPYKFALVPDVLRGRLSQYVARVYKVYTLISEDPNASWAEQLQQLPVAQ